MAQGEETPQADPGAGAPPMSSPPATAEEPAPAGYEAPAGWLQQAATLLWIAQGFVLFAAALGWFAVPGLFLAHPHWFPAHDVLDRFGFTAVRERSPFALALALASTYAAMREDAAARRTYARCFAATFALWAAVDYRRGVEGDGSELRLDELFLAAPLVGNLFLLLFLRAEKPKWRRLSGSASTLPPGLWLLWVAQGTLFMVGGALLMLAPESVLAWTTKLSPLSIPGMATHLRLIGPMMFGLGMFSWSAMRAEQEWLWRTYAASTSLFLGLCLLTLVFGWQSDLFERWAGLSLGAAALLLIAANQSLQGPRHEWYAEDTGHGPDGWVLMDLLTGPMFAVQSLFSGRRGSHLVGTAAAGTFEYVETAGVPANDFFKRGLFRPAVVRFSSVTWRDQAAMDVRGCALRLAPVGQPSPFDMGMNTGVVSPAANVVEFGVFVLSKWLPLAFARAVMNASWRKREDALIGMRRAPECYSMLRYHSQTVRLWVDRKDVRHLVRYRMVPADLPDGADESGLPDTHDYKRLWDRKRRPDEARPTDYLTRELQKRLHGDGTVRMKFQAQFHTPEPGDGVEWFNSTAEWPEAAHPWLTIGDVVLERWLPDEEAERLQFNSGRHPASLSVPIAPDARDYRSLADSERRVIARLAALRRWRDGAFGLPRFGDTAPKERP